MSELYTKLFVNSSGSHEQMLASVASAASGRVQPGWTVVAGAYELDVRPNEDARQAHGDDFLFFPFTVELVAEGGSTPDYLRFVGEVMNRLHAGGMQVVAACDWEDQLPGGGKLGV